MKSVIGFAGEGDAIAAGAMLEELSAFESCAVVIREESGAWFLECYDGGALAGSAKAVFAARRIQILSISAEAIPATDWVAETQRLLPPVHAGRFIVHGSHDRSRICSQWGIEIDAGRAFGTAHHGTTKGCLLALDALAAIARPRSVLDLGTGSGVLAIAAARAFRHRPKIGAVDIDPVAIAVARGNSLKNGAAADIRFFTGDGVTPSVAYSSAPFDIVIANILATPLIKLATRLRSLTKTGGTVILSGLLVMQAREVLARYRAVGFRLVSRTDLEGWVTLILRRGL